MKSRTWWVTGAVGVAVVIALVVAIVANRDDSATAPPETLSPVTDVIAALDAVPDGAIRAADASLAAAPSPISATPINSDGKPLVLYVGAEFCPFCAAERWPLYLALAQFGTFDGVTVSRSSSTDVHPNTPTLSFHGATYTSDVLAFQAVEVRSNVPDGEGGYEPLDTLTPEQQQILGEVAPDGGIPVIDIGGSFLVTGSAYDPGRLAGMSALDVARSLGDPAGRPAASILAAARSLTTSLCALTGGMPATACAPA